MVISNKSCCKHVLFMNLSDFISTTTRVTSVKYKKFLLGSFSVAKFGIAPPPPPPLCSCNFKYQLFCIDVKEKFHNFVKGKDWSLRSCSFPLMWRRSFYNFVKEKDWSLRSCGKHVLLSVRHVSCLYYGAENITLIIPDPKIFSFSLASSYLQP